MSSLPNPFNTLQTFEGGKKFYSLPALEKAGFPVSRLPVSIRLVLESVLRNCDGKRVLESNIKERAAWKPTEARTAGVSAAFSMPATTIKSPAKSSSSDQSISR